MSQELPSQAKCPRIIMSTTRSALNNCGIAHGKQPVMETSPAKLPRGTGKSENARLSAYLKSKGAALSWRGSYAGGRSK